MSSSASSSTLDLRLRPSPRAVRWLLGLHAAAILLTVAAQPPKWAGLALALLFMLSWLSLRRHAVFGYGAKALNRLVRHAEGGWTVETASGAQEDAELLGSSVVQADMMVLNFRLKSGARRTRIVLGDEADAEQLRRLRARLLVR